NEQDAVQRQPFELWHARQLFQSLFRQLRPEAELQRLELFQSSHFLDSVVRRGYAAKWLCLEMENAKLRQCGRGEQEAFVCRPNHISSKGLKLLQLRHHFQDLVARLISGPPSAENSQHLQFREALESGEIGSARNWKVKSEIHRRRGQSFQQLGAILNG